MIRQPNVERQVRLSIKTLDQAALNQLVNDFACSPFESKAIVEMMHLTFEQAWQSPTNLKPGQMLIMAIDDHEPPGKPLKDCRFKPVVITLHNEEDETVRQQFKGHQVITELRRTRLGRIADEVLAQGAYLTVEDVADLIFNCGERTIVNDLKVLRQRGQIVPLRGQQADIGRGVSHKIQVVKLALQRHLPSAIARRLNHSLHSVERYLSDFSAIATLLAEDWPLETISLVRHVSLALVREYQVLYLEALQTGQGEALADLMRPWTVGEKKESRRMN